MRSECDEQRSGTANPGQTTLTRYCQQPQQRQQPEAAEPAEPAEAQPENDQMLMLITKFTKTSHTHTTLLSLSLSLCICVFVAPLSASSILEQVSDRERARCKQPQNDALNAAYT